MRIALVYDTVYPDTKGGVEKRVAELAARLATQNDVHLLVPLDGPPGRVSRKGVTLRGVTRRRNLYTPAGRRAVFPALAHALGVWKVLRRDTFDVVDCQIPAFPAAIAAWWATRRRSTRLVVTWHEAWGQDWIQEMGVLGHIGRLVERFVARLPAVHLAVSQHVADVVSRLGGRAPTVILPGVGLGTRIPDPDPAVCDILFVGRLIPTKNLGLLIAATRQLVDAGLSPRVTVIGEGPARAEWERQTRRIGLDRQIRFRGELDEWDDVIAVMQSAKIFALPSLREGFGMVALEAAACGIPVVTVDHRRNAARHVVVNGVTGLCVPPDPGSFAGALRVLLEDEGLRSRMGREARARAKEADWDVAAARTRDLYAGVA